VDLDPRSRAIKLVKQGAAIPEEACSTIHDDVRAQSRFLSLLLAAKRS